jgi:hypothetical protein
MWLKGKKPLGRNKKHVLGTHSSECQDSYQVGYCGEAEHYKHVFDGAEVLESKEQASQGVYDVR